ncbi:MAG: GNAT family N-acetyltransferase [Propionibacteriaceae bacterium]|nr:GNAT family N-acetyltransferase [Micropruina sp.]HBX82207.1 N-acetyltransferase [Propionibacteriaceae bacterium]HBY22204.1 N-acetyltransferase [Propionibacteriaceae bacterium]
MIRELGAADVTSPDFVPLLREAVTVPDAELHRIIADEFPLLSVIGVGEPVLAFAAFAYRCSATVVEYVAVSASHRGQGWGRALIDAIRARHPDAAVVADTDDDAVEFYERLGFSIEAAAVDPRWPERQRYRCRLAPLVGEPNAATSCDPLAGSTTP